MNEWKEGLKESKEDRPMKRFPTHKKIFMITLTILVVSSFAANANLRIMSYNIKDFWLRFDGESGSITNEGAELDRDDLEKLEIIAAVINEKKPDVIGILESASLAELLFFNKRFLEGQYRSWSFRAYDHRDYGIPLGLMVKKDLEARLVSLIEPRLFSYRGIIVADISKADYEFTLILVHLKSKMKDKLGESAQKRNNQGDRLREIVKQKLKGNPSANIIICGDFNDTPGRDEQEIAANVEDLIEKMLRPVELGEGRQVTIRSPALESEHKDLDINRKLWTEKTKEYGAVQFDYFFLTEGASDEFLDLDHIYPEEFPNILDASDHIPIILDLKNRGGSLLFSNEENEGKDTGWYTNPQWWIIIVALSLGILGVFQNWIRSLFRKPKLEMSIRLEPPDCHKVPITERSTGRRICDSYYFRFKMENVGNYRMEDAEVMITDVYKKTSEKKYEQVKTFLPLNLTWAYYRAITMSRIQPHLYKHCDLGHIVKTRFAKLDYYGIPTTSQVVFELETAVKSNIGSHILLPGDYRIKIIVAANNLKPQSKIYNLVIRDGWTDDEKQMLGENVSISEAESLY